LSDGTREDFDLYLTGCRTNNSIFLGGSASLLQASALLGVGTTIQSFALYGDISFASGCTLTDVVNHGILQNHSGSGNPAVLINGNFPNYGTLRDHPDNSTLIVNANGDLQNYGTWAAQTTNLTSTTSAQSIMFPQSNPCMSASLYDTNSTTAVHAVGDIWFQNCTLYFNHSTLVLDTAPNGIYTTNGNLNAVNFQSVAGNVINMSGGTLSNVAFQSITNTGTLTLATSLTVSGELINAGTIQNNYNSSSYLIVQGNLVNNGSVINHPDNAALRVRAYGNITNTGIWSCQYTDLYSTSAQSIMFPQAHPCMSPVFYALTGTSAIHAVGDIWFQNSSLNFNSRTLVLDSAPSGIYITNGNLSGVNIQSVVGNVINMSGGTITNTSFTGITNAGTLVYNGDGTISGDLVNNGYIQNNSNSNRTLTVQGSITNNGCIRDNPAGYTFVVKCGGNIVKSGIISCSQMFINGTADQTINRGGTLAPAVFYLVSELGNSQWFLNGSPSGYPSNSQISIPITSDDVLGTWQPYYPSTETWGRTITILPAELPAIPQSVWIEELQSGVAKLHWNEDPNAASYSIYVSDDPYSGFTLEWDNIIDPNPGNGTMEFTVATSEARKFFRVTARN